jgi:Glyoxalase-like domain
MQMHLDFFVDDLEATGVRAVAAGADLLDLQPNSDHCVVYADPRAIPSACPPGTGRAWTTSPDEPAETASGLVTGGSL